MIRGLEQLASLEPENLIGAHGPPFSGQQEIKKIIINYRDTLQFLWDQTVRCANKGLTLNETINVIKLPRQFSDHYTTQQLYGLVEHHVRQIYTGLFGWFDGKGLDLSRGISHAIAGKWTGFTVRAFRCTDSIRKIH